MGLRPLALNAIWEVQKRPAEGKWGGQRIAAFGACPSIAALFAQTAVQLGAATSTISGWERT